VTGRDLHGDAGANRGALTGADPGRLGRVEVEAGVALVGAGRQPSLRRDDLEAKLHRSSI
jgi:hypothetical protein